MISDHDFMNTSDLTWSLWTPIIDDQYHTKGPYVWSVIMDDFLLFMHDSGDRHYETLSIIDDHCWSVHHIMHDQWWSCYEKLVIIDDKYWSVHHIMTPRPADGKACPAWQSTRQACLWSWGSDPGARPGSNSQWSNGEEGKAVWQVW